MMAKQQKEFQEEYEALLAKGESWAMYKAMQSMWKKNQEYQKELQKKRMGDMTIQGSAGRLATMMDGADNLQDLDVPMVKIGDASVASPFTSKMPSIRGAVDIIRQGRCTLVTTIQMYQILALHCLISAYSLSVQRLDGIKYGERQMTALGILMSVAGISISRSQPLERLSIVRPLTSVFHPSLFFSLIGQFVIHLATMYFLVVQSKKLLPFDYVPDVDSSFQPGLVNTVVFLVSAVQQVSVFVVNLKGPPFMSGLNQNWPLLYSLAVLFVGIFLCATESIPQMNKFLQLVPLPTPEFRNLLLASLVFDVAGAFVWDRLMLGIFAYPILRESMKEFTWKECFSILRVFAVVFAIVYYLATQDYTEVAAEWERMEQEASAASTAAAAAASEL